MSTDQITETTTSTTSKRPRRRLRRLGVVLAAVATALSLAACQSGTMWQSCKPAADGNPFGQDGTYILGCKDGEWVPIMTVGEYLRIRAGESVTIAPVPQKPQPAAKPTPVAKPAPKPTPTTQPAPSVPSVPTLPTGGPPLPPPV